MQKQYYQINLKLIILNVVTLRIKKNIYTENKKKKPKAKANGLSP